MSRCKPIHAANPKTPLEQFLGACRKRAVSPKELEEYAQIQRDRVKKVNCEFGLMKLSEKFATGFFVAVQIDCVTSSHEFSAIPVQNLIGRDMFQCELNSTYESLFEPFNTPKAKDICMVRDGSNWCRGQIVEIDQMEKFTVHLFDYGRTIEVEKCNLSILREPHDMIWPFEMKCQLSILHTDESELPPKQKDKLMKKFGQLSSDGQQFLVYVNGQFPNSINDVFLFTDCESVVKTVYGAYALHEVYGAFVRSKVRFDNELCEKWCERMHSMAIHSDATKKVRVWLSYIASPTEIYVKCRAADKRMSMIRTNIDKYVASVENQNSTAANWSIDDDCLVRTQNWNTKTSLKLWYRGRIIGIDAEIDAFKVFLRDYGRKVDATHSNLMAISAGLAKPCNAVQKCSLSISTQWLESSTKCLQCVVDEYKFFAISCMTKADTDMSVVLWATNASPDIDDSLLWDDIGLAVVSVSIRESMESFLKKSQRSYEFSKYTQNDNSNSNSNDASFSSKILLEDPSPRLRNNDIQMNVMIQEEFVDKWPRRMSIDRREFVGIVTHITENGAVYVQEESNYEIAAEVTYGITSLMKSRQPNAKNHEWKVGEACFVEFEIDSYYRAVVKQISREDATCLIQYVDYGDKVIMHLNDLNVATNYGNIPVLAHKFFVSKLKPNAKTGKWFPDILSEFKQQLLLKTCDVRIDNTIDNHNNLKILPCSIEPKELPCDIFKWLCNKKFGIKDVDADNEEILIVG